MICKLMLAIGVSGACSLLFGSSHSDNWPVRAQGNINKTMPLSGSPMRVVIDNVEGYVHVSGYEGSEVRITAHKTVRAETEGDLRKADEVQLRISGEAGSVSVYYDAPWRCEGEYRNCNENHERRFYAVTFDIDVQMPQAARVFASTINGGDVRVAGVEGHFEARNINGGVALTGMGGSGDAHTINGPVSVRFTKNPTEACSFKSINGSLDVYFPQNLSADLLFKTFNGDIYSDFEVTAMATAAGGATRRSDGKFVYRSDRAQGARAGGGGPQLSFDTLNGSIRLHRVQ